MVTKVAPGSVQSCALQGCMEGLETQNQGCEGGLSESYGGTLNEEMESDAASEGSAVLSLFSAVQWSC